MKYKILIVDDHWGVREGLKLVPQINKKEVEIESYERNLVLTDKEKQILKSVAHGFKSKEIAFDMEISERTVKAHLTNIYNKLGVDSRPEAVAVSLERGILQL